MNLFSSSPYIPHSWCTENIIFFRQKKTIILTSKGDMCENSVLFSAIFCGKTAINMFVCRFFTLDIQCTEISFTFKMFPIRKGLLLYYPQFLLISGLVGPTWSPPISGKSPPPLPRPTTTHWGKLYVQSDSKYLLEACRLQSSCRH